MAIVSVSAELGCPLEEVARLASVRLNYCLLTEFGLGEALAQEFGAVEIPPAAWAPAVHSILCRLVAERSLVLAFSGCEHLFPGFGSSVVRIHLTAPEPSRVGLLMLEHHLDRTAAKRQLTSAARKRLASIAARFPAPATTQPDLTIHLADWSSEQAAQLIEATAVCRQFATDGLGTTSALKHFEFDTALALASHGIAPKGKAQVKPRIFSHPSEELFANLLDFYRIAWVYEPRSFPLQWNESGDVTEAFTPDFYLPEGDLYVELTTMKQALVTRKNRKVKHLKAIYPHINIQIFYQKDFQELVFKYGIRAGH